VWAYPFNTGYVPLKYKSKPGVNVPDRGGACGRTDEEQLPSALEAVLTEAKKEDSMLPGAYISICIYRHPSL
jgi:hypothetical protein